MTAACGARPFGGVSIVRLYSIPWSLVVTGKSKSHTKKGGGPLKRRSGPSPEVLRKGGAHKDRKRKTGREPIPPEELDDSS